MKILSFIVLVLIVASCHQTVVNNDASIEFENTEYNYGKMEINGNGIYAFKFSNSGNTPLIIRNVTTSCGCTVPEWPKKPVKPGETASLKVNYDTSKPGVFRKTITVFFNGVDSPVVLSIRGEVNLPKVN